MINFNISDKLSDFEGRTITGFEHVYNEENILVGVSLHFGDDKIYFQASEERGFTELNLLFIKKEKPICLPIECSLLVNNIKGSC